MACPFGSQYTCMKNPLVSGSPYQCSPYSCISATTQGTVNNYTPAAYADDGPKDASGNCLGTTYMAGRCRPTGYTVGYINDCCQSDNELKDNVGTGMSAMSGVAALYQMGKAMYIAKQAYDLVQQGIALGRSASEAAMEVTASFVTEGVEAGKAAAEGASAAASGASSATAMTNAAVNAAKGIAAAAAVYAAGEITKALGGDQDAVMVAQLAMTMALMSGPQMVIGIIIIVVMRFLMGSGCDEDDINTSMFVKSKRCHKVGDYCEKKWFTGCVQTAKRYCCFNSMMARIVHEQGRPQLNVFGPDGGWGPTDNPNCRGFTPEEFQSLDFNRIDLSEYYNVITENLAAKAAEAQQAIQKTLEYRMVDDPNLPSQPTGL